MDYIKALDEERKKILVFEKELPLSLQLVTQAIETCKQQQQQIASNSEEICSELGPVLEEFIPLRPSYSSSSDEENSNSNNNNNNYNYNKSNDLNGTDKKPDWLRSVQLWNQQPEADGDVLRKPIAVSAKRIGGAFRPFEREKVSNVHESSSTENNTTVNANRGGGGGSGEEKEKQKEKEGHSHRKARRCWSPELHHRFLHALQQLGGSHAATPKQIRELMKVDGLTNDEVKSHLQKYRLHTRRPANRSVKSNSSGSPQQPQIVLVSGIWVPPPAYTTEEQQKTDSKGIHTNAVYTPVASLPLELGSKRCNGDISSKEDGERTTSDSSSTSSSSQTTVSPPF